MTLLPGCIRKTYFTKREKFSAEFLFRPEGSFVRLKQWFRTCDAMSERDKIYGKKAIRR